MTQKQREARLNYVFKKRLIDSFDGMLNELTDHYKKILKENEKEDKKKFIKITPEMFRDVSYTVKVSVIR